LSGGTAARQPRSPIPELSAILVHYRQPELAALCVATLRETFVRDRVAGEIVLVDCGSGPADAERLAALPADTRVFLADNRGYSGGVNAGLARARSARLLLSNVDVTYRAGSLRPLLVALDDPAVGAAAPVCEWDPEIRLLLPPGFDPGFFDELALFRSGRSPVRDDSRFAHFARDAIRLWTLGGRARHLSGAVLAVRRDVFDRVGRFDERFPFEYEETEWERRVHAARLELRVVRGSRVRHAWGASASGSAETDRRRATSRRLYRERRFGRLGRAILESAERRSRPSGAAPALLTRPELPPRPGAWVGLSPHRSRIPFLGADLSSGFRLSEDAEAALPAGDWFWTVFSSDDGRPFETHVRTRTKTA
jgi:GT2 family glycosyltransferase